VLADYNSNELSMFTKVASGSNQRFARPVQKPDTLCVVFHSWGVCPKVGVVLDDKIYQLTTNTTATTNTNVTIANFYV
jgi:hypothetical protein